MFGFGAYMDKIQQIKWYFPIAILDDISKNLFVTFIQLENYFKIEEIHYSVIDILMGLEGYDFTITKHSDQITIKIHPSF